MKSVLLSVLIPILALLAWLYSLQDKIDQGTQIRVRVEGYDPRDLLAGHYVNFELTLGTFNPCQNNRYANSNSTACVCYNPESSGGYYSPTWSGDCSSRPSYCQRFLKGTCKYSRFDAQVNRYSIPEKYSPVLITMPENSSTLLSVTKSGTAHVLALYVGEQSVEEYAEQKLREVETQKNN
jgi:hypothetical protein